MYNSTTPGNDDEQYYEMKYYKYKAKIAGLENKLQTGGSPASQTPVPVPVSVPVPTQKTAVQAQKTAVPTQKTAVQAQKTSAPDKTGGYDDRYYEMKYYKYKAKIAALENNLQGGSNTIPNTTMI